MTPYVDLSLAPAGSTARNNEIATARTKSSCEPLLALPERNPQMSFMAHSAGVIPSEPSPVTEAAGH
jgi:hypothetical protein